MAARTKLGAIDAGSNAIRVVIAELGQTELVRVEAERLPVRLGHNAFTRGLPHWGMHLANELERLIALCEQALYPPKPRKKTKPTKGSKRRRLDGKKRHGDKKRLRGKSFD